MGNIRETFQFHSITEVVRTNRAFYAATMGEGSDLNEHITKMTELASRLKDLKDEVTSKKFATVILGSLPTSYNHFLTSLNARDASTLDWDQIKPLLLEEYMLRKEKRGSEDALMTRRNPGGNDWGFSKR